VGEGWDPLFPAPADETRSRGRCSRRPTASSARPGWSAPAEPGRSVRYAGVAHGRDAGTVTVTLDDATGPGESRVATVEYDLTALSAEAAGGLARFAAGLLPVPPALGRGDRGRYPNPGRSPRPGRFPAPRTPGKPAVPADGPGLFTIGHSNQALDDFLDLLQQHRHRDRRRRADRAPVPLRAALQRGTAPRSPGRARDRLTSRWARELGGRPAVHARWGGHRVSMGDAGGGGGPRGGF